ncbi:MAG: hypothetical protein HFG01_07910 [Oscillibacter sp.]|jgi:hypothetical protein|uniref:hypothetical protein n=1 Tax=uncultured Oscillibacter sp. TaxID=876091 RepID=UPI00216CDA4C|nr:hypothetical protein [uncultured Oscillibacter sp.]MCI8803245.1 hypothetical protein [Oscillibacter sp.]
MYNRYIRNDNGSYTRLPEEEPRSAPPPGPGGPPPPDPSPGPSPGGSASGENGGPSPHHDSASSGGPGGGPSFGGPGKKTNGRTPDGLTGFLQHILNQLHLDHVDTGDLLLLVLLFFLFREDADEELLVALGLLLIL